MGSNTYTEEEFKKVFKNLFSEKKRIRELEKQLEKKGLQKRFQEKLKKIHTQSILKSENEKLLAQLAQVRPVLKKLLLELKNNHSEIITLKSKHQNESDELKKILQKNHFSYESLQQDNNHLKIQLADCKKELDLAKNSVLQCQTLEAECAMWHENSLKGEEQQRALEDQLKDLKNELQACQEALIQVQAQESEKKQLVERLAEVLGKMQRQSEMLAEQREEIAALQKEKEKWEEENMHLRHALDATQKELQTSDFVALRQEYEAKVQEALISFSKKEVAHDESLERCYLKMREMAQRHAEMIEEREKLYKKGEDHHQFLAKLEKERTALQNSLKNIKIQYEELEGELAHGRELLAKKVKETTFLGDLVESQKNQILELQKECQEQKRQLSELGKMRTTYEHLTYTFSNLKTILGNTLDPLSEEPPQDLGH